MKAGNQVKLPEDFKDNEVAINIGKYLAMLGPSSGFYSCILYGSQGKYYFLNKDPTFPYIPFDWTMYIFMRSRARTILTTGLAIRREPEAYRQTRGAYGRKFLEKIFEDNTPDPFNFVVYTQKMKQQEIRSLICEKYHKFVSIKSLAPAKQNLKQIAQRINQLGMGPTMYECGQKTLGKAMQQVGQIENSFVEMIMLSLFEGMMPSKFIEQEYYTHILDRDFNKVWESEVIKSTAKHEDGQELPVTLKFVVYMRKNKSGDQKTLKQ